MKRPRDAQRRLHALRLVARHELEVPDPVLRRLPLDRLERRHLCLIGRDDQLAELFVRNPPLSAVVVEHVLALDAEPGLEAAGRIVDPGVDHLRVPRGCAGADPLGRLQHPNLPPGQRQCASHREPDHPGADHHAFDPLRHGGKPRRIAPPGQRGEMPPVLVLAVAADADSADQRRMQHIGGEPLRPPDLPAHPIEPRPRMARPRQRRDAFRRQPIGDQSPVHVVAEPVLRDPSQELLRRRPAQHVTVAPRRIVLRVERLHRRLQRMDREPGDLSRLQPRRDPIVDEHEVEPGRQPKLLERRRQFEQRDDVVLHEQAMIVPPLDHRLPSPRMAQEAPERSPHMRIAAQAAAPPPPPTAAPRPPPADAAPAHTPQTAAAAQPRAPDSDPNS